MRSSLRLVFMPRPSSASRVLEHLADHRDIAGRRKRGLEQSIQIGAHVVIASRAAPAGPLAANRPRSSASGSARVCEGSRSRSIVFSAAAFPGSSEAAMSATTMRPGRVADACHLAQHRERIGKMMERKPRHDDRERTVRKRQRQDVAHVPADVGQGERCCMLARLVDHRRSQIDAGRMPARPSRTPRPPVPGRMPHRARCPPRPRRRIRPAAATRPRRASQPNSRTGSPDA